MKRISLTQYLVEQQREHGHIPSQLRLMIEVVARACKTIAINVNKGALGEVLGSADTENVQGEVQKKLDVIANDVLIEANQWGGHLAAMASEEMDSIHVVPDRYPQGEFLLLFDPLDGSSNIDVNVSIGTIFSVLRKVTNQRGVSEEDFLQPGKQQAAAGYCVYGPQTTLVLTVGDGVAMFTLDREMGSWVLTADDVRIPEDTKEFAINMSNLRHWAPPVRRYIDECLAGKEGPRGKDFNMRWVASMVADVHRILTRGGIFLYPWDKREPDKAWQAAPDVRGQPDGLHRRAGRRPGHRRQAAHHGDSAHQAAPACERDAGLEERGSASNRLPPTDLSSRSVVGT